MVNEAEARWDDRVSPVATSKHCYQLLLVNRDHCTKLRHTNHCEKKYFSLVKATLICLLKSEGEHHQAQIRPLLTDGQVLLHMFCVLWGRRGHTDVFSRCHLYARFSFPHGPQYAAKGIARKTYKANGKFVTETEVSRA